MRPLHFNPANESFFAEKFPVTLLFISCSKILNFQSVKTQVWNLFPKIATRWNISSEPSCSLTSSWYLHGLTEKPMNAKGRRKLNHFEFTPQRCRQEHMAEIYRWVIDCCSSEFLMTTKMLQLAHPFQLAPCSPPPPGQIYQVSATMDTIPLSTEYTVYIT